MTTDTKCHYLTAQYRIIADLCANYPGLYSELMADIPTDRDEYLELLGRYQVADPIRFGRGIAYEVEWLYDINRGQFPTVYTY